MLSFDEALAQILSRSTSIATQEANSSITRARDLPIRLAFAPSLSFDAKHTSTGGTGIDPAYSQRLAEGVAQVNLFHWGADYKNWQAAIQDEDQQQLLIADAYLRAQDTGVQSIVTFIQRRKEIGVAEEIVRMREASLGVAQQRYSGGYLPRQELDKVQVDLANARARLADAEIASYQAAAALENLMGHSRVAIEWPWAQRWAAAGPAVGRLLPAPAPAPGDDTALAQLLSRRPDWRAAQARAEAEEARLSRSWRLMLPSLDAQLNYGYYNTDANYSSGAFSGTQWKGTLSITLPFFDRLTLYSQARAQSFVQSQAEIALEQVRRDARSEWTSARETFITSLGSVQVRDQTLTVSRKLYADGLARFRNGRINADDLVLEQARLYESELLDVQSWAAVHLAYSRLCKAQGLRLADCKPQ